MSKKRYEMSEAQLNSILDACKPVPYMVFGGIPPRSPQENANAEWQALGDELGFEWDSVEPVQGESQRVFLATPKEPRES